MGDSEIAYRAAVMKRERQAMCSVTTRDRQILAVLKAITRFEMQSARDYFDRLALLQGDHL